MENALDITIDFQLPMNEIEIKSTRSGGPGGQNVNKVETGIELRFDINASSIPDQIKEKALNASDNRITKDGTLIIQATNFRTQEKNKQEAIKRLIKFLKPLFTPPKVRKKTVVSFASIQARIKEKQKRTEIKKMRQKPDIP